EAARTISGCRDEDASSRCHGGPEGNGHGGFSDPFLLKIGATVNDLSRTARSPRRAMTDEGPALQAARPRICYP
ncbi:hypothetical protein, partial [Burkholderia ambifaria]|uniref:hypothetical protein n=1 Tax=Burkholderia ambifaria TaxID=152480 RepID=UPI001ABAE250